MISAIKQWYNDIRFPARECHTVEVFNAYEWSVPSYPGVFVTDEIEDWLEYAVLGKYLIHEPKIMIGLEYDLRTFDPAKVPCRVSFSRATDAMAFKMIFS